MTRSYTPADGARRHVGEAGDVRAPPADLLTPLWIQLTGPFHAVFFVSSVCGSVWRAFAECLTEIEAFGLLSISGRLVVKTILMLGRY